MAVFLYPWFEQWLRASWQLRVWIVLEGIGL